MSSTAYKKVALNWVATSSRCVRGVRVSMCSKLWMMQVKNPLMCPQHLQKSLKLPTRNSNSTSVGAKLFKNILMTAKYKPKKLSRRSILYRNMTKMSRIVDYKIKTLPMRTKLAKIARKRKLWMWKTSIYPSNWVTRVKWWIRSAILRISTVKMEMIRPTLQLHIHCSRSYLLNWGKTSCSNQTKRIVILSKTPSSNFQS